MKKISSLYWITEISWNAALAQLGDKEKDLENRCLSIIPQFVSKKVQGVYLHDSFNTLFRDTAWSSGEPGVTNIFWYNYHDTGQNIIVKKCRDVTKQELFSASYTASYLQAALIRAETDEVIQYGVPWGFGLYHGNLHIDPIGSKKNPTQCIFAAYPEVGNYEIDEALWDTYYGNSSAIFLPIIMDDGPVVTSSNNP